MGENSIIQEILERIVRIETKIDGYNNLREKLNDTYNKASQGEKDIFEIKNEVKEMKNKIENILIKPANNVETYKVAAIAAIVTAIVGFVCGKVL